MVLYHATFEPWVQSIVEKGLIPRFHKVWEDCEEGIFLANDPYEAESYCEIAENEDIPEDWLDDIVVFVIDISKLDPALLGVDPHNIIVISPCEPVHTWIYRGIIPTDAIKKLDIH